MTDDYNYTDAEISAHKTIGKVLSADGSTNWVIDTGYCRANLGRLFEEDTTNLKNEVVFTPASTPARVEEFNTHVDALSEKLAGFGLQVRTLKAIRGGAKSLAIDVSDEKLTEKLAALEMSHELNETLSMGIAARIINAAGRGSGGGSRKL